MAKEGKFAIVPKLRFPKFLDSPGWRLEPLSTFVSALDAGVSVNAGGRPATPAEIGVLKTSCVTSGVFELSENKVVLEPEEQERVTECVRGGTIIISRMNTIGLVGANAYVENDAANIFLPDRLWAAKPAPNAIMRFIASILGSDRGRSALSRLAAGSSGSMKNIAKSAVMDLLISAPEVDEQQKIAECLRSLDTLIAAQRRKVEVLKTYKRGLMQELFPREGETLPLLRFPDFRDSPEWNPTTLDALVDFQSGSTPSKANLAFWNGSIPWVSAKDMKRFFLEEAEDHISTAAVNDGAKLVPAGTVLILTRGMTLLKDVPICVMTREMSFNQDVKALLPKGDAEGLFVALLLLGSKQRLLRMVDIAGHGTGKLNTDELRTLQLTAPMPAEQQRIAGFLSFIDVRIAAEADKFAALEIHKKGLLQQLFPSMLEAP
jgi:type I restriction enzyme, S subunit